MSRKQQEPFHGPEDGMSPINYPLDQLSSLRHLATKMDDAKPEPVSMVEVAKTFSQPNPADISRVRRINKLDSVHEANLWLVRRAADYLVHHGKVVVNRDLIRFADGVTFADLTFDGRRLHRDDPDDPVFGDPFNPNRGVFAKNIRDIAGLDDSELRESMRKWGWDPKFPAYVDERGTVIVGNRRMKIAKELGIEPQVVVVPFGRGDAADAERFRLAIISNIGAHGFSNDDKKRIAQAMRVEKWTIEAIADALKMSPATVSRATRDIFHDEKSDDAAPALDTRGRKRSPGRPRTEATKPAPTVSAPVKPQPAPAPQKKPASDPAPKDLKLTPYDVIAVNHGLPIGSFSASKVEGSVPFTVYLSPDMHKLMDRHARRCDPTLTGDRWAMDVLAAGLADEAIAALPLSATAQEKIDAHIRRAERDFDHRVRLKLIEAGDQWAKQHADAKAKERSDLLLLAKRARPFSAAEYKKLQMAVHTDRSASDETLNELFHIIEERKAILTNADDDQIRKIAEITMPTARTVDERERKRAEYQAEQAAKRAAARQAKSQR